MEVETFIGRAVIRLDESPDPLATIRGAAALIVTGGNTWCLAHHLRQRNLVVPIRQRVAEGVPFLAWGAGAVMASPSLMTTSDLPECAPAGMEGLHLVPFHVAALPPRCHGRAADHCPTCGLAEDRIAGLSAGHRRQWIVGLAPDAAILVDDSEVDVVGAGGVALFREGKVEGDLGPGSDGRFLLDEPGERHPSRHQHPKPCRR